MEGQFSDEEFRAQHPTARIFKNGTAITRNITVNYWIRHQDGSWSNYKTKL